MITMRTKSLDISAADGSNNQRKVCIGNKSEQCLSTLENQKGKTEHQNATSSHSANVNQTEIFPVGVYRKTSEMTLISMSQSLQIHDKNICGRKWIVLTSAFWSTFLCAGFPFNMSVLNLYFLEEFGKNYAETSLVQAVTIGTFYIVGLPVGVAVGKYGAMKVGVCGSLFITVGLVLSFFGSSISYLVITVGCLSGSGCSACYIAALTAVGEYFVGKPKLEAMSFISFGNGCGAVAFPYLLDVLTTEFGWRGCLLIVGALMMNLIPCFAVCKTKHVGVTQQTQPDISILTTANTQQHTKEVSLLRKINVLRKNTVFFIFTLALIITLPAISSVLFFFVNFFIFKGFDKPTSVFFYAVMSISSAIFRLVPGFMKRIPHLSVLVLPGIFTCIGAVTCAVIPGSVTFTHNLVCAVLFGMTLGGQVTLLSVATAKLVGLKYYSIALGLQLTAMGIGNIFGGPIAGYLRDTTGSYNMSFYLVSGALALSTCLFTTAAAIRKYKGDNQQRKYIEGRGMRRRSSIVPWKRTVEFIF